MSDEELASAWAWLKRSCVQDNPFLLIEEGHLSIKTKAGELRPLILNKSQLKLFNKVKELWNANKIIRIIILKARQLGISTLVEALLYSITSQIPNQNSLIIAHDKDGSDYLFEMSKLYQEKLETYLRPETKKSNEKKLEFEGTHSQILIETAENKEAGRSLTLRCVHLSEYAFFRLVNANLIMLGLSHSVPTMPRTIMIKESTANGFNHFKDDWDAAVSGKTDEVAIFIPWYWGEEYMMEVPEGFVLGDGNLGDITKDEVELARQMEEEGIDLINERLQWRRWDIKNNCKGDLDKFKQENPSTPEEAFIASGQCFFDQKQLVKQLKVVQKPLFRANIVKENFKYVIRKCADGDYDFYEEISKNGQYCIGGDAASGSGADFSCIVARNKSTNKVCAVCHAKYDPDELAYKAMLLGSALNNAKVAIENDKFGFAANEKLRTIYGNVYVQRTFNKVENKIIEKIGWDCVAPDTKILTANLIWKLAEEIVDGEELLCFEENSSRKKDGKYLHRKFNVQTVKGTKEFKALGYKIYLEDGRSIVVSNNHPFLTYRSDIGANWRKAEDLYVGINIKAIPMWEPLNTFEAGRLSGLLCGEGYLNSTFSKSLGRYTGLRMHVSQSEGLLADEIIDLWHRCGFDVISKNVRHKEKIRNHHKNMIYSGIDRYLDVLIALGKLQPKRLIRKLHEKDFLSAITTSTIPKVKVVAIHRVGYVDVVGIETSGHTLITNGLLSHNTTAITRPLMLGQMQEEIREGSLGINDERIIRECLTFIKNAQTKKAEAEEGKNDDLVIATAISGQIRHDDPFKVKPERPRGGQATETKRAGMAFGRKR